MIRIYILFFFTMSYFSYSQNVTLDELINLRKNNLATIEEKLTLKGWSYVSGEEPNDYNLGKATFAYNKSNYEDKAESFINYIYSEITGRKRIDIQIVKKDKYNLFLARIKSLGCKLLESHISEGSIKKIYQGATLTFVITVSTQKDDFSSTKTLYHFFIIENSDYRNNFDEKITDIYEAVSVDTTASYTPEAEEIPIKKISEVSPEIDESFFIGKWSNENSTITFLSSGDFIQNFDDGNEIKTKWKFVNNKLFVGIGINSINYIILENNSNYMSYKTSTNSKIFFAFRVGN